MSAAHPVESVRTHHILLAFPHRFHVGFSAGIHTCRQSAVGTWLVFFVGAVLTQWPVVLFHIVGGLSERGLLHRDGFQSVVIRARVSSALGRD